MELIKSGFRSLNKVFGGGFELGDFCMFNFDAEDAADRFLLNLFRQMVVYNQDRETGNLVFRHVSAFSREDKILSDGDKLKLWDLCYELRVPDGVNFKTYDDEETTVSLLDYVKKLHVDEGMNVLFLTGISPFTLTGLANSLCKSNVDEIETLLLSLREYCRVNDILVMVTNTTLPENKLFWITSKTIRVTEIKKGDLVYSTGETPLFSKYAIYALLLTITGGSVSPPFLNHICYLTEESENGEFIYPKDDLNNFTT